MDGFLGEERNRNHTFPLNCFKLRALHVFLSCSLRLQDSVIEPMENPCCHVTILVFYPVVYVGIYHYQELTVTSNQDHSFVTKKIHCCEKQKMVSADLP